MLKILINHSYFSHWKLKTFFFFLVLLFHFQVWKDNGNKGWPNGINNRRKPLDLSIVSASRQFYYYYYFCGAGWSHGITALLKYGNMGTKWCPHQDNCKAANKVCSMSQVHHSTVANFQVYVSDISMPLVLLNNFHMHI